VRGTLDQFGGSAFFKFEGDAKTAGSNGNVSYDNKLRTAFTSPNDSKLKTDGKTAPDPGTDASCEQARQMRGMIVHDIIAGLQKFVASSPTADAAGIQSAVNALPGQYRLPFYMGLVFQFQIGPGGKPPSWLTDASATNLPALSQRNAPVAGTLGPPVSIRTFNTSGTDFASNSPRFDNVRQYADAHAVGITWDLAWTPPKDLKADSVQADVNHHLKHYIVRRHSLSRSERDVITTITHAECLLADNTDILHRLQSRFKFVDHFSDESAQQIADIPANGLSYVYSITPVCHSGSQGRPLTIVATRTPSTPPLAPASPQMEVRYRVEATGSFTLQRVQVTWTDPGVHSDGLYVPADSYELICRSANTVPVGSYGIDAAQQPTGETTLPNSAARPLPTDIRIPIPQASTQQDGPKLLVALLLDELSSRGVIPSTHTSKLQSWTFYLRAISVSGVPSSLAPVHTAMTFVPLSTSDGSVPDPETRDMQAIEWLPAQLQRPGWLSPRDMAHQTGIQAVPMPAQNYRFSITAPGELGQIPFNAHPSIRPCIQILWNQGPSAVPDAGAAMPDAPLDMYAGYHLYELDVDALTDAALNNADAIRQSLRRLQHVQLVPAGDEALLPADTQSPSQWEAWYPSDARRLQIAHDALSATARSRGAKPPNTTWYSWQDSYLEWPEWAGITDVAAGTAPNRSTTFHPLLKSISDAVENLDMGAGKLTKYKVDLQPVAIKPADTSDPNKQPDPVKQMEAFFAANGENADPYGWRVLQTLGLAMTFTIRRTDTGEALEADSLISVLQQGIQQARSNPVNNLDTFNYLHVELLVQPGASVSVTQLYTPDGTRNLQAKDLLAMVQLSLRPLIKNTHGYFNYCLQGDPTRATTVTLIPSTTTTGWDFVNASDRNLAVMNVQNPGTGMSSYTIELPATSIAMLLARAPKDTPPKVTSPAPLPTAAGVTSPHAAGDDPVYSFTPIPVTGTEYLIRPFDPIPLPDSGSDSRWEQVSRLGLYLAALYKSSGLPATPDNACKALYDDYRNWAARFMAHSANLDDTSTVQDPWLAVAYPKAGSPAYATPDAARHVSYFYVRQDQYAHNSRFYILPYGRYDMLFESIGATLGARIPVEPPISSTAGGLDVVLDRLHPVDPPALISVGRLDPVVNPGQVAVPGATWEALVAQHPEQSLSERNQTARRRLGWYQIIAAMTRTFAYDSWLKDFATVVQNQTPGGTVITITPSPIAANADCALVPAAFPNQADEPGEPASNVASRATSFQQAAVALQWEGLPFFYEHRLLLAAQTATTVSDMIEVSGTSFEYLSPAPIWNMTAEDDDSKVRFRSATLLLARFWDSLPSWAQGQWQTELPADLAPSGSNALTLSYSALPDMAVVYQILLLNRGNSTVEAEIYYDPGTPAPGGGATSPKEYSVRQTGKQILAAVQSLKLLPQPSTGLPNPQQYPAALRLDLQQVESLKLTVPRGEILALAPATAYSAPSSAGSVAHGYQRDPANTFTGVMSAQDRLNLVLCCTLSDQPNQALKQPLEMAKLWQASIIPTPLARPIDDFLGKWYGAAVVSGDNTTLTSKLDGAIDFVEMPFAAVVWAGDNPPTQGEKDALAILAAACEPGMKDALTLLQSATAPLAYAWLKEAAPKGTEAPGKLKITAEPLPGRAGGPALIAPKFAWAGPMMHDERDAVKNYKPSTYGAQTQILQQGIAGLLQQVSAQVLQAQMAYAPVRPHPDTFTGLPDFEIVLTPPAGGTPDGGSWTLKWSGPVPADNWAALHAQTDHVPDPEFVTAVQKLIAAVNTANPAPTPANPVTQTISYQPPRYTASILASHIGLSGNALQALSIPSGVSAQVTWTGLDTLPNAPGSDQQLTTVEMKERVANAIPPNDPIIPVINGLMDLLVMQICSYQSGWGRPDPANLPDALKNNLLIGEWMLQCKRTLTSTERDVLTNLPLTAPNRAAVNRLLTDVANRDAIDSLYNDWFSTVPVSKPIAIPAALIEVADFSLLPAGQVLLRYHGLMTAAECDDLVNRYSTPGEADNPDQQAIRALLKSSLTRGLNGGIIKVRTYRGSAAPSSAV
jgi:hypothetical protein